jgi:HK97 family phage major capsid protein
MANIAEIRTQREKLLLDARAILQSGPTTEQRVNAEKMISDAAGLLRHIENLTAIDGLASHSSARSTALPVDAPADRRAAVNAALRTFLRAKNNRTALSNVDTRALTFATEASVILPIDVAAPVMAQKSAGAVYDVVRKIKTQTGDPIRIPLFNATGDSMVLNSTAISTTDPSLASITNQTDICRINPVLIDNALINDTTFDLVNLVETGFRQSYALSSANFITNGNGSNVQSIVSGNTNTVTSAASGVIGYGDLLAAIAVLDPAYQINAMWSFSNLTLAQTILNIKDTANRPIFLPFLDGGNSGFNGTLFGFPVKLNQFLPAVAASSTSIQFGDFMQGYTYREVDPGLRIEVSDIPFLTQDQTVVVGFARVGGSVTDAGTHPMVNVVTHV